MNQRNNDPICHLDQWEKSEKIFDALERLAVMITHVSNKGEQAGFALVDYGCDG